MCGWLLKVGVGSKIFIRKHINIGVVSINKHNVYFIIIIIFYHHYHFGNMFHLFSIIKLFFTLRNIELLLLNINIFILLPSVKTLHSPFAFNFRDITISKETQSFSLSCWKKRQHIIFTDREWNPRLSRYQSDTIPLRIEIYYYNM